MDHVNVERDGPENDVKDVRMPFDLVFHYKKCRFFSEYFRCKSAGHFPDELMKDQGKYFWCIAYKNGKMTKLFK